MLADGDYHEVARWLWNFLTSHAKREDPRCEVLVDTAGDREGTSYGVRLRLGEHLTPPVDLEYRVVAEGRGRFAWCKATAARIRAEARELSALATTAAGTG